MYVHIFNSPLVLFKQRNNKQSLISKHKKMKTGIFQIDYVYFWNVNHILILLQSLSRSCWTYVTSIFDYIAMCAVVSTYVLVPINHSTNEILLDNGG
jgi:hypothetical protein